MANIQINEISQNYSYNIGSSSFCTVALPITASWGPALIDPKSANRDLKDLLESVTWKKFPATQAGVESFISAFRGPAANYRIAKDYSYHTALTLLANGYDVLVCRLCPGTHAEASIVDKTAEGNSLTFKAKYPGTFGNSLQIKMQKVINRNYWNAIVYVVDITGVKTAVENLVFTFNIDAATDSIMHISEIESNFVDFVTAGTLTDTTEFSTDITTIQLSGGTDRAADGTAEAMMDEAITLAEKRFSDAGSSVTDYKAALTAAKSAVDVSRASSIRYMEWLYTYSLPVYDLLKDKISYSPARIISPGWDDQNIQDISGDIVTSLAAVSPIHIKLMDVAYHSRCAVSYLDIPKCLPRSAVHDDSSTNPGYAQKLARFSPADNLDGSLYNSHSTLFAPWGQFVYTGTSKMAAASPSFLALIIERAMIKNQSLQYEWIMPSSRKHNLPIGKLAYTIPKTVLDTWQNIEGTRINILTEMPDMGIILWGNSTLFEVPPATYQALANLSTRKLVNAVEDVVYKVGLSITFNYNNDEAYSKFYVGVSPILDSMKNAGAIVDYKIKMSADINGVDSVNANTVIGKIYLTVNGVIEDINVDLIALPSSVDLSTY